MDLSLFIRYYLDRNWIVERNLYQYKFFLAPYHFQLTWYENTHCIVLENKAVSTDTRQFFVKFYEHLKSHIPSSSDVLIFIPSFSPFPFMYASKKGKERYDELNDFFEAHQKYISFSFNESMQDIVICSEFLFRPVVYNQENIKSLISYITTLATSHDELVNAAKYPYSQKHSSFTIFKKRVPYFCFVLFIDADDVLFVLLFDNRIQLLRSISELECEFHNHLKSYVKKNRLRNLFQFKL